MTKIEIYTDGACSFNPGPGGWSFCIVKNNNVIHTAAEGLNYTTNNICELLAICNGLNYFIHNYPNENDIVVYSDSAYCVNGYNEWMDNWKRNGFLTAKKEPVKNREHWEELLKYKAMKNKNIKILKIKGHSGNTYNSLVDRLAVDASKLLT